MWFDSRNKVLLKKAFRLIGPLLFVFIFMKMIDMGLLAAVFKSASLKHWFVSILCSILFLLGKIYRIHLLLNKSDIKIKFFYLAKIYSCSFLLGQMSNVLVADIANAGILFKDQKNKLRISNIFIVNKAADFLMIFLIFLLCFSLNYHVLNTHINFKKSAFLFLVFLLFIVTVAAYLFKSKLPVFLRDFSLTVKSFGFHILAFTIIIYFFSVGAAVNHAKAFDIHISLSFLMLVYSFGNLITVLPISVSGIGTRDLAFIFLMNLVNISSEKAFVLSSVGYIITPLFAIAAIYAASVIGSKYEDSHYR